MTTLDNRGNRRSCLRRFPPALLALGTALAFAHNPVSAGSPAPSQRQQILDAIRPVAAQQANQAVRFKVDRLNREGSWAVLVGELVGPDGRSLDWAKATGCEPELDKMLWAVAQRTAGHWQVEHLQICAAEPPYWYLDEDYGGLAWPCAVYAGLNDGEGDLQQRCEQEHATRR